MTRALRSYSNSVGGALCAGADALGRHRERAAAAVARRQVVLSAGSSLPARSQRRGRRGAPVVRESRGAPVVRGSRGRRRSKREYLLNVTRACTHE